MAVTIVVLSSGGEPGAADPSLTLDAPRIVIGRGEGCDVRLPDASVSHRHASIRQRGGEYVVLDENSQNGTFLDRVRLPPQTPRAVRSGERVRLGRVWIELRVGPAMIKGSTAAAAKELALSLVARGLAAQGEEARPRLTILEGPDAGASLILNEVGRTYAIGRGAGVDLVLSDPGTGRRHATVTRKAEALFVEAASSVQLDGEELVSGTWRPGQVLEIGGTRIGFEHAAAEALAEIERCPDDRMAENEAPEPPPPPASEAAAEPEQEASPPPPLASQEARPASKRPPAETGAWNKVDSAVVLMALGVLALSIIGAFWLLGR